MKDIAVLLTVRDWDLTRVEMCLRSVENNHGVDAETVVIDYGSVDPEGIHALAQKYGCKFQRIEATEWSRSIAMNAAARLANARHIIFADADLAFAPTVLSSTVSKLNADPNRVLLFQFRDLPSRVTADQLIESPNFAELDDLAIWRPRWGMGVQAYPKKVFDYIRGFDDRMKIYGGEDNDIAKRARANGIRLEWVNDAEFGLYHVWHPSSRILADSNLETRAELEKNVEIAKNDHSKLRNLQTFLGDQPLVSVVITTFNRSRYLSDSIRSVLWQTCQDFELIVLDDGSTDDTEAVVRSFEDDRIRYYKHPRTGIPALRNKAAELSDGRYTAIHDDDDIMLPWSLEVRLNALVGGIAGSYGGAYDFDNDSGEMQLFSGRAAELASVLNGAKVFYHATLLIETRALRAVKYDEAFASGSDYNLALRLMKSGIKLEHCNDIVLLRRLHHRQVTVTDQSIQHGASYASAFAQRASWGVPARAKSRQKSKELGSWKYSEDTLRHSRFYPYLPSHLVRHSLICTEPSDALLSGATANGVAHEGGQSSPVTFIANASPEQLSAATGCQMSRTDVQTVRVNSEESDFDAFRVHVQSMLPDAPLVFLNPDRFDNGFVTYFEPDALTIFELSRRFPNCTVVATASKE